LFWWLRAADQGIAQAQFNVGSMYGKGQGAPKNDQQAAFWYRKAAEQGFTEAQLNLGFVQATGQGVVKDDQQAYFWWLLASVKGDARAIKNRDLIEARLTPQQRATAQADARSWKPGKP